MCHARGLKTLKMFLKSYDLRHKCMHKNCLFDKAVDLWTICWGMKYFIYCTEFILVLEKLPGLPRKYGEGNHREIPCVIKWISRQ